MNLKKSIVLFLAFLLLVSNGGFAFDVHYCGGKIASVSLNTTATAFSEKSCCAKVEKKSSCCKDKIVHLEKKSNDATFKIFLFQLVFPAVILDFKTIAFLSIPNFRSNKIIAYCSDANAPPLFKLYHQYIFYA